MMHSELIEWRICHPTSEGWAFHSEGAQSTFGLTRARKIVKVLGPPWEIRHQGTNEEPKEDA